MGQAAVSKPSTPQLGEVEMGMEALLILNSREEYSTAVTMMLPSHSPSSFRTIGHASVRKRRVVRSLVSGEREEEEEEEENNFASPSNLSPPRSPHSSQKFNTVRMIHLAFFF